MIMYWLLINWRTQNKLFNDCNAINYKYLVRNISCIAIKVLAITIIICSVFGLPWFVAATVLSINHIQSLTKESESSVPGEKPQFLGIREQRVTHVLIAICLGLSTLITPLLALIPMPVLFGIFLYMGVNSLKGLQFFDRLLLLFIPKKYQPDYIYLKYVPLGRVHVFTIVQLSALIGLWIIKNDPSTSISFPIMLVVICGIRKGLECFFTRRELLALDDLLPEGETKRRHGGKESSKLKSPKNPNRRRHSMELQEAISRNPSRSPRRRKKMMITHERKPQVSYPIVPFSSSSSKEPPQLLSLPQTNTFNRTLIFVKLTSEDIHVPLHIESSSVDELIRSLHELYPQSIPPSVSQRFKQNANGILFRLNDDLLEYMNQNEAYEVLIEENEDQETSLTLIEKSI
ncbi:Anion exchange protein [Caligus rogercresseyi]|uniref:Anion exchange protein n=1 Tax=Caligus rogercresseyi TaxID=217165 RepID=A0A7T8GY34_CALRO|nr:Anion exchange protein [Caligus rogercresseyi]